MGVALPSNIYQEVFTTLAWDNIDRLEETTSGEGASYRVNGIAVQARIIGPMPQVEKTMIEKSKNRSISPAQASLPMYNAGKRVGPSATVSLNVDADKQVQNARVKNLIWLLTRMSNPEDQTISSWTGFNILIRSNIYVVQDTVSYLPTINAPATEMSTINEVLTQTLNIMETLGLKEIVCVFDQALYAKAAEIIWKHEKFQNIKLRMGKRFQEAGLRDVCVESGVIAEGSITAVMEGRKYNRAVRLHKIVYEASMRLALKGFLPWFQVNHRGFSLKRAAVERYFLTSEYRSMFLKQLRMMVGCGMSHYSHPDLQMPRITRDEADVQSIVRLLEDDWMNPFEPRQSELSAFQQVPFPLQI